MLCNQGDEVVAEPLGVEVKEPDPVNAGDVGDALDEGGERWSAAEIAPLGDRVL